jgi:hypothetical protein
MSWRKTEVFKTLPAALGSLQHGRKAPWYGSVCSPAKASHSQGRGESDLSEPSRPVRSPGSTKAPSLSVLVSGNNFRRGCSNHHLNEIIRTPETQGQDSAYGLSPARDRPAAFDKTRAEGGLRDRFGVCQSRARLVEVISNKDKRSSCRASAGTLFGGASGTSVAARSIFSSRAFGYRAA